MPVILIISLEDDLKGINANSEFALDYLGDDVFDALFKKSLDVRSYCFETHDAFGHLEEDISQVLGIFDLLIEIANRF